MDRRFLDIDTEASISNRYPISMDIHISHIRDTVPAPFFRCPY
jgi:hypothetical protein